jgi:DNA-binding MarR family transcriptional regulator
MSRILNELESARLVRRKKMTDDSRSFEIALTPAGTKLMAELTPFLAEVEELQLEGIDRQDADRLRALLVTVFENMTRARSESKEKGRKYARSRL